MNKINWNNLKIIELNQLCVSFQKERQIKNSDRSKGSQRKEQGEF